MTLDCQLDSNGNPPRKKPPRTKEKVKYVGCREQMEIKRVKQIDSNSPDPWVSRKLAVGIVIGVFGYSYYVFVVRLCVPMIRMQNDRLGARAQGLVYLVVFHFLFILFCWSYIVAISTPPGFARDYIPQTDPPRENADYVTVAGQRFEDQPLSPKMTMSPQPHSTTMNDFGSVETGDHDRIEMVETDQRRDTRPFPPLASTVSTEPPQTNEEVIAENAPAIGALGPGLGSVVDVVANPPSSSPTSTTTTTMNENSTPSLPSPRERVDSNPNTTHTFNSIRSTNPPPTFPPSAHLLSHDRDSTSHVTIPNSHRPSQRPLSSSSATSNHRPSSYLHFPDPPVDYEPRREGEGEGGFVLKIERVPPIVPVLTEQYRYDAREGLVRPFRSHRCRHCAAVVLKMDHHCPWMGSCIGARNYKYFYNFLQASSLYLIFIFLTVLIAQTLPLGTFNAPSRPYPGVDRQQIAIIALSFLFGSFTTSLWVAHTRMLGLNLTTIEEMAVNRVKQKERVALNDMFGFWGFRAKREHRKAWDRQWGRLGREGNLWWLGSKRRNWEMVMGERKLGWLLPIPASPTPDDGLHYVPNPRFSPEGVWRKRKHWPKELQPLGL